MVERPAGTAADGAGDDPGLGEDPDAAARVALNRARDGETTGTGAGGAKGWRRGPGLGDGISGPGPSRRDPQPLGGLTELVVTQHGWRRSMSVGGVVGRWREVVGDQLADHCQVETFDGGELVVRASSTAWATQIRLLLPQLERRLAEEVGEGTVTAIVVLGPGGPSWKHGRRAVRGRGPRDTYG